MLMTHLMAATTAPRAGEYLHVDGMDPSLRKRRTISR